MKYSTHRSIFIIALAMIGTVLLSCKKEKDSEPEKAPGNLQQTSEDHALLDNEFNTVFNTVDNLANEDTSISGKSSVAGVLPSCASKSFDLATKTLVIDFGSTNCLCADGLNRRGKIIAIFDGKYRTIGTKVTVTLDNYFVGDIQFKGTKTIENLGSGSGHFKYSYHVTNAEAITTTGTIKWETDAIIERVEGDTTFTPWDDIYEVTGKSEGTTRRGTGFTVEIDANNPLVRKISLNPLCWRNFVSGIMTMKDDAGNEYVLDYDPDNQGLCDKEAELTINGGSPITIFLR